MTNFHIQSILILTMDNHFYHCIMEFFLCSIMKSKKNFFFCCWLNRVHWPGWWIWKWHHNWGFYLLFISIFFPFIFDQLTKNFFIHFFSFKLILFFFLLYQLFDYSIFCMEKKQSFIFESILKTKKKLFETDWNLNWYFIECMYFKWYYYFRNFTIRIHLLSQLSIESFLK